MKPQFGAPRGTFDTEMVAIDRAIISQRTGSFDPRRIETAIQRALPELIEAKLEGLTGTAEVDPRNDPHSGSRNR